MSLYTACAGIDPAWCLPITLDVGTNNQQLLEDPLYSGLPHRRLPPDEYDALLDEFMQGAAMVFPQALVQFEDFGSKNAFRLLTKYRDRACCFNDDIQGTAAMCLAGLITAVRLLPTTDLAAQKILFLGAGQAGVGIAHLVTSALVATGLSERQARQRCWFFDVNGLVVDGRASLEDYQRPYAHDHEAVPDLHAAIHALRPSVLIGVSGQPQTFTRPVVEAMSQFNDRPIIFALSNPTSKSECTAEQAYGWSRGRAIFASGSPFPPVHYEGKTLVPGQANNAHVFPGVALGVVASGATRVTDAMFLAAAHTLADAVDETDIAQGNVFPPLGRVREISASIAVAVAEIAFESGLAAVPRPRNIPALVEGQMYHPTYENYA